MAKRTKRKTPPKRGEAGYKSAMTKRIEAEVAEIRRAHIATGCGDPSIEWRWYQATPQERLDKARFRL